MADEDKPQYYRALYAVEAEHSYDKLFEFFQKEQARYYETLKSYAGC